jgi:hypothetical protein
VVVSLPYEVFTAAGARGNSHEVLRTLERNPTLLTRLGLSDLLVVSQENDWLFGYLGRVIRASAASALRLPKKYDPVIPQLREAVFVRASFNEFGDHVGHWSVPQAPDVKASPIPTDYWPRTVSRLVEFEEFLTTRGVRLFYAFPAIPSDVYADPSSRRFIDKVAGGLRRAGVRAINRPEEVVLPPEAFLDSTGKHPMRAGVETYSQLVAERLRTAESCLPRH